MNTAPSDATSEASDPSPQALGSHPFQFRHFKALVVIILLLVVIPVAVFVLRQNKYVATVKDFTLVESSPTDHISDFSPVGQPTFVFSMPLNVKESELKNYFHITPNVSGTWHIEKNKQVVYFSSDKTGETTFAQTLTYNTVYHVSVDKRLPSANAHTLQKDISVVFRTAKNPLFNLTADKKLISVAPHTDITVGFNTYSFTGVNQPQSISPGSQLSVTVQTATIDQLLAYFAYKKGGYPMYEFAPQQSTKTIAQFQTSLTSNSSSYTSDEVNMDIPDTVMPGSGLYFVTVKNQYGSEDFFIAVSNHINQVISDSNNSVIWTTDQSGKSISGVNGELYKDTETPKVIDHIMTGPDGIVKSSHSTNDYDFVVTHTGSDVAISFTSSFGYDYGRAYGPPYQTFSYSDRPVYRPGDVVHYKAVIRNYGPGGYTLPKETHYFYAFETEYVQNISAKEYKPIISDENGTVNTDVTLPQTLTSTYPNIILAIKNSDGTYQQINSFPIVVTSYRKPDMDITATASEKEYISSDEAHFTVTAKTNYGQPLTNMKFTYRVSLTDTQEMKDRTLENIASAANYDPGTETDLVTGTGIFDNKGIAHINFSTSLPVKYEQSQIATLQITPNVSGVPSIGKIAKLIHRGEFALFFSDTIGDTGQGISGTVTVLDHKSSRQPVANESITVSLYHVLDYQKNEFMTSQNASSSADGTLHFSFPKVANGSYELVAQGPDSRGNVVTTRYELTVGEPAIPAQSSSQTLSLETEKSVYKPGETAKITATTSDQVTDALVTVAVGSWSSSTMLSVSKTTVHNTTWTIPIPVQKTFGQQAVVNVYTVIHGSVVTGESTIVVNTKSKQITTSLSFDKPAYKPGDTVKATITTKDTDGNPISADNSLSVMDAALLQIGQITGDIWQTFYQNPQTPSLSHYDSTTGIFTNLGGGGGGCFLAGTNISMANGTTKRIEDVKVGDRILTKASDGSSRLVSDTVVNTYRHAVTDYLIINNSLKVTWIHRIFLNNAWHEAIDAKVGDNLLDENGNQIKITSITHAFGQFVVYNLTTKTEHTFFADGFYVHNDKGLGPRQNFVDTAYWNPHIQTDQSGKATVSFTLPDNLTTFSAQVISNTKDSAVGQGTGELIVKKPLTIIPGIANFYYTGDKPDLPYLIHNDSGRDVDATVNFSIKELGIKKSQEVKIPANDFATVTVPVTLNSGNASLTYLIEAKDKSGELEDSVSLTRPLLPRGTINTSWLSFTGSRDMTLKSTYKNFDVNTVSISVIPNALASLFTSSYSFSSDITSYTGEALYSYSYILAKTRDGDIPPTSYQYAAARNSFRMAVAELLRNRQNNHWEKVSPYTTNESLALINLWLAKGFEQAASLGLLTEIKNAGSIAPTTEQFVKSAEQGVAEELQLPSITPPPPPPLPSFPSSLSGVPFPNQSVSLPPPSPHAMTQLVEPPRLDPQEEFIREWVLRETPVDKAFSKTAASVSLQVLQGAPSSVKTLRSLSIPSADDRYFWNGSYDGDIVFPALAMIEKGSLADADRAMKGLSFEGSNNSLSSPLTLLAGLKYAERRHLKIDAPSVSVTANDNVVFETPKDQKDQQFSPNQSNSQTLSLSNTKDGSVKLSVKTTGDIPYYTTIMQTDYGTEVTPKTQSSLFSRLTKFFSWQKDTGVTQAKIVDMHLTRSYRDGNTGQKITSIPVGESGIVELRANNIFTKYALAQNNNFFATTAVLQDAISPAFLYLNQSNVYAPQFVSVLNRIYQSPDNYSPNYFGPTDYSDEAVFFNGSLPSFYTIIMPYVVYNMAQGTYYQPKTNIVFPLFGIISQEK